MVWVQRFINKILSLIEYTLFLANIDNHPCWTMLECPKVWKNPIATDHLVQFQELQTEHSHHLHGDQSYPQVWAYHNCYGSSPNKPIFVWLLWCNVGYTRWDKLDYEHLHPFVIHNIDILPSCGFNCKSYISMVEDDWR